MVFELDFGEDVFLFGEEGAEEVVADAYSTPDYWVSESLGFCFLVDIVFFVDCELSTEFFWHEVDL